MNTFFILSSTINWCISISAFSSFLRISIGITSSAIWLKICAKVGKIENYNLTTEKKRKRSLKVLLAKTKLDSIKVSSSNALFDKTIGHDEFVLIKNVLKECDEMKEEIKNLKI